MTVKTRKIRGSGGQHHTGGYEPFVKHEKGAGHKAQPKGHSVGYTSTRDYSKNEASGDGREPGQGHIAGGHSGGSGKAKHSKLAYNTNDGGKSFGVAGFKGGESFRGRLGSADSFRGAGTAKGAAGFRGEGGLRQGALRLSGDSRAHRVGARGKGK